MISRYRSIIAVDIAAPALPTPQTTWLRRPWEDCDRAHGHGGLGQRTQTPPPAHGRGNPGWDRERRPRVTHMMSLRRPYRRGPGLWVATSQNIHLPDCPKLGSCMHPPITTQMVTQATIKHRQPPPQRMRNHVRAAHAFRAYGSIIHGSSSLPLLFFFDFLLPPGSGSWATCSSKNLPQLMRLNSRWSL